MIKKLFAILTILIGTLTAYSQEDASYMPLPVAAKYQLVDSITADYTPWKTASISGKLSSPMLPVTASVKIYMEKDSLMMISISAFLVGEAARIEIDTEKAIVVNKLKNAYTVLEVSDLENICPGGLNALQNIFLGRIAILGAGELSTSDCSMADIYSAGDKNWMLLPVQDIENSPMVYFYTLTKNPLILNRLAILSQDGNGEINFRYAWNQRGMTLDINAGIDAMKLNATLDLNTPDLEGRGFERFKPTAQYKKTDLKGVLK